MSSNDDVQGAVSGPVHGGAGGKPCQVTRPQRPRPLSSPNPLTPGQWTHFWRTLPKMGFFSISQIHILFKFIPSNETRFLVIYREFTGHDWNWGVFHFLGVHLKNSGTRVSPLTNWPRRFQQVELEAKSMPAAELEGPGPGRWQSDSRLRSAHPGLPSQRKLWNDLWWARDLLFPEVPEGRAVGAQPYPWRWRAQSVKFKGPPLEPIVHGELQLVRPRRSLPLCSALEAQQRQGLRTTTAETRRRGEPPMDLWCAPTNWASPASMTALTRCVALGKHHVFSGHPSLYMSTC